MPTESRTPPAALSRPEVGLDAEGFRRWLARSDGGPSLCYHTGFLLADRARDRALHELAEAALLASGAAPPVRRVGGGRHPRQVRDPPGPRLVDLVQRRLEDGRWEYVAVKVDRGPSP